MTTNWLCIQTKPALNWSNSTSTRQQSKQSAGAPAIPQLWPQAEELQTVTSASSPPKPWPKTTPSTQVPLPLFRLSNLQFSLLEDIQRNDHYPRVQSEPDQPLEHVEQLGVEIGEQSGHTDRTHLQSAVPGDEPERGIDPDGGGRLDASVLERVRQFAVQEARDAGVPDGPAVRAMLISSCSIY